MNRGQLRAALLRRLGVPASGDGLLSDTALNELINDALRDLSNEQDWPWLLRGEDMTYIGSDALVPADFVRARELTINDRRARYVGLAEFLDARVSGVGCVWTLGGGFAGQPNTLTITPAPSTTFTQSMLWYQRAEPSLDDDPTEPILPAMYHHVLLARAAYLANVRRNRQDESVRDDNEYQLDVRKMRTATASRTGPRTVRAAGTQVPWAVW